MFKKMSFRKSGSPVKDVKAFIIGSRTPSRESKRSESISPDISPEPSRSREYSAEHSASYSASFSASASASASDTWTKESKVPSGIHSMYSSSGIPIPFAPGAMVPSTEHSHALGISPKAVKGAMFSPPRSRSPSSSPPSSPSATPPIGESASGKTSRKRSSLKAGTFVEVETTTGGEWVPAQIKEITSRAIVVQFSDGTDKVFRDWSRIREVTSSSSTTPIPDAIGPEYPIPMHLLGPDVLLDHHDHDHSSDMALASSDPMSATGYVVEPVEQGFEYPERTFAGSLEEAISIGICTNFLQGKCRYKGNCSMSHNLLNCVYCMERLPSRRVAASAHLRRCFRASGLGTAAAKEW